MDKILFLKIAHDRTWSMSNGPWLSLKKYGYSDIGDSLICWRQNQTEIGHQHKLSLKYVTNIDVANISYRQYDMV